MNRVIDNTFIQTLERFERDFDLYNDHLPLSERLEALVEAIEVAWETAQDQSRDWRLYSQRQEEQIEHLKSKLDRIHSTANYWDK